jgi:hypothetical protein
VTTLELARQEGYTLGVKEERERILNVVDSARAEGARDERAKLVAWLRELSRDCSPWKDAHILADELERLP